MPTDIAHVMDDADVGRAPLVGVSIGGYVLFEFWRKHRGRVAALGLCNTKAPADSPEARAGRLQAANDVFDRGTEPFFESMVPRLLGKTTREMRPDLVDGALRMMRQMSPEDVAQVQRGMADAPDSIDTLKTINVPTLLVTGDEDILTGVNEAELMRRHIAGSQLRVIPKAGHYSPWEQPQEAAKVLRQFGQGPRLICARAARGTSLIFAKAGSATLIQGALRVPDRTTCDTVGGTCIPDTADVIAVLASTRNGSERTIEPREGILDRSRFAPAAKGVLARFEQAMSEILKQSNNQYLI